MLTALFSNLGLSFVDKLLGRIMQPFEMYFKKQIGMEELRAKLLQAVLDTVAEIEKAHAEAITRTFAAFMDAAKTSKLMQVMWASALGSQIFVLFWYQWVVPFIVFMGWAETYPSAGSTVEWAYLLIGGLLGLGPIVLRSGPGAGNIVGQLKGLIGK